MFRTRPATSLFRHQPSYVAFALALLMGLASHDHAVLGFIQSLSPVRHNCDAHRCQCKKGHSGSAQRRITCHGCAHSGTQAPALLASGCSCNHGANTGAVPPSTECVLSRPADLAHAIRSERSPGAVTLPFSGLPISPPDPPPRFPA